MSSSKTNKTITPTIKTSVSMGIMHELRVIYSTVNDNDFASSFTTKSDTQVGDMAMKYHAQIKQFDGDTNGIAFDEFAFSKWQEIVKNKKFRATYSKFFGDTHTDIDLKETTDRFQKKLAMRFFNENSNSNKKRGEKVKTMNDSSGLAKKKVKSTKKKSKN